MAKILDNLTDPVKNNSNFGSLEQNSSTLNNSLNQSQNQTNSESSGFFKLPEILLEFVPFIPSLLEKATGQKVPNTISDLNLTISQVITGLQAVITNQQQIYQRLINLETTANSQLTNLTQQFQSLRLTHTKERKEIDFNPNKNLETNYE
jgi:hypothetical protein